MTEETTNPETVQRQNADDAHSMWLVDILTRVSVGRSLTVIVSAVASMLFNAARDMPPAARNFIAENLVKLANDILQLNNQEELPLSESQAPTVQ